MTYRSILTTSVILIMSAGVAHADVVFDYNGIPDGTGSTGLSSYMTALYGSDVSVTDGRAESNPNILYPDWIGNPTTYVWTAYTFDGTVEGDLEISFDDTPITAVKFDGYVFDATRGADFVLRAYTSDYTDSGGTRGDPDPAAEVFEGTYNGGVGGFSTPWITFTEPVTLLVFSDHGLWDIGIDNLQVKAVPAPGAAVLALMGMTFIGWLRRSA